MIVIGCAVVLIAIFVSVRYVSRHGSGSLLGSRKDGVYVQSCSNNGFGPVAVVAIQNTTGHVMDYDFTVDFLQNGQIFDQVQRSDNFIPTGQLYTDQVQEMLRVSGPIQCKVVDVSRYQNVITP